MAAGGFGIYTPCAICRCRPADPFSQPCGEFCGECESLAARQWPVSLGLSIRRFVRRAEVERLRQTVRRAWRSGMDVTRPPSPQERRDAVEALDRLAALAMEVEP